MFYTFCCDSRCRGRSLHVVVASLKQLGRWTSCDLTIQLLRHGPVISQTAETTASETFEVILIDRHIDDVIATLETLGLKKWFIVVSIWRNAEDPEAFHRVVPSRERPQG